MRWGWLTSGWLALGLSMAGLAIADGGSGSGVVPPARGAPEDHHLATELVTRGDPRATIIMGSSGEYGALARSIQQTIEHITGVRVPIATDDSEAAVVPIRGNLIVIGSSDTNQVVKQLHDRYLCLLEAGYPGPDGYVVRTIHDPFGTRANVLLISGGDGAATSAAVSAFAGSLQHAGGEPGSLSIGWLMETKLGRGFDPDKDVAQMGLWESSEWYGPARAMGWTEVSEHMARYYLTGQELHARRALSLLLRQDPTQQEPPVNGDSLTRLLWDLIDESPVFTDTERSRAADALARGSCVFFDQTYVHTGTHRLYRDWDFVHSQPQHEGTPLNWEAPLNYRDGTYDFEVEVLSMARTGLPMFIQFGWTNAAEDPEKRHIASPAIRFDAVGTYRLTGAVSRLPIFYGAGPKRDQRCTIWDWRKAFKEDPIYTLLRPVGEAPAEAGYPYTVHVRVTLHPASLVREPHH